MSICCAVASGAKSDMLTSATKLRICKPRTPKPNFTELHSFEKTPSYTVNLFLSTKVGGFVRALVKTRHTSASPNQSKTVF